MDTARPFKGCSVGSVRNAVALASEGVSSRLHGTVAMSAEQGYRYAHSLGGLVLLRVEGPWLYITPN